MTKLEIQKTAAKIAAHASAMQSKADLALSLLEAVNACIDHPERKDLMIALVEGSIKIADEISHDLENLTFPNVEAAA